MNVLDKFLKYISYDTQSDDNSNTYPSTEKQLIFGQILVEECKEIGLKDVYRDNYGYVFATLPSNINYEVPTIGFLAHMDTSSECSGKNVKAMVIENYDGKTIDRNKLPLSSEEFPDLKEYIGDTIICSDGTTLLGADDKAGIAEIMTAMEYLISNPDIPHGTIKIAFTPDEEVGRGVDYFDVKKFGADFAYTFDGGAIGELECENFNAAGAKIKITGKSVHPGYSKGLMINAGLIATEFASMLPEKETPSHTYNYEGFYHLNSIKGTTSEAELRYIIRDFLKTGLEERKSKIQEVVKNINEKYNNVCSIEITDEYENMKEIIDSNPQVFFLAKKAMDELLIKSKLTPIRGGTDGARLSYMGLPCPNIFAGGHNFHGPYEFIPLSSMEKAVELIVKIVELNTKK